MTATETHAGPTRSIRALWGVPVPGWKPPMFANDLWLPPVENTYHVQGAATDGATACRVPDPHELVLLPPSWVARFGLTPCFVCRRAIRRGHGDGWADLMDDLRGAS